MNITGINPQMAGTRLSRPAFCRRGLSLIEMLTVTVIVSVLAIILVPLAGIDDVSKREDELRNTLREIRTALSKYRRDMFGYPCISGIMGSPAIVTDGAPTLKKIIEVALLHPNHMPLDRENYGIDFASRDAFIKDVRQPDKSVYVSAMNWTAPNTLNWIEVKAYLDALDGTPAPPYVTNGADPLVPYRTMVYLQAKEIGTGDIIYKFKAYNRSADKRFVPSDMECYYNKYQGGTSEIIWSRVRQDAAGWDVWRARVLPPYLRGDGRVSRFDAADAKGFPANPLAVTGGNFAAASDQWEVLINLTMPLPGSAHYKLIESYLSAADGITPEQLLKDPGSREVMWWPITTGVNTVAFRQNILNHFFVLDPPVADMDGSPVWGGYTDAQWADANRILLRDLLFQYLTIVDIRYPCNFLNVMGLSGSSRSRSSKVQFVNGAPWSLALSPFLVPKRIEDNLTLGRDFYYWEL